MDLPADKQKLELALKFENARLKAIIESMSEGLLVVDKRCTILMVNPYALHLLGGTEKQILGNNAREIMKLWKKDRELFDAERPMIRTLLSGRVILCDADDDLYYHTIYGKVFPVALTTSPIRGININDYEAITGTRFPKTLANTPQENEDVVGCVVTFADITKEKQLEQARYNFISVASHELRTPLSTINWYSEVLLGENGITDNVHKEYITEIGNAAKRMNEIVESLLNVSRIQSGTYHFTQQPVEVAELISTLIRDIRQNIETKKIKFTVNIAPGIPEITTELQLLKSILLNLINNAVKYTGIDGSVTINLNKDTNGILFSVSDTGIGIPKEEQPKIFSQLFRATNAQQKQPEGIGLGLFIVKSFTERLGGTVWFESEENKGTTFYLKLPEKEQTKTPPPKDDSLAYKNM